MRLEWDEAKNAANRRKHGLSFDEARALFSRPDRYLEIFDEVGSIEEDRFIAIGPIRRGVIVVVHTEREHEVIRIISARWATEREKSMYRVHMEGWK